MGEIASLTHKGQETRLTITPLFELTEIRLGESIAVNGVCLTVETATQGRFEVYASAETMARTNLGNLQHAGRVNLERALSLGDRLGGHLVTGHVDCLATVESISPVGESRRITLTFPLEFGGLVVGKGSVALDGISLTINTCTASSLEVNIIPATWRETAISKWKSGTKVNMETDIIGKYVLRMLGPWKDKQSQSGTAQSAITMDFLKQHGF